MKKNFYSILIFLLTISLFSCKDLRENPTDSITGMNFLKGNEEVSLYRIKVLKIDGTSNTDICLFDNSVDGIFNDIKNIIKCETLDYSNGEEIKPIYSIIMNPKWNILGERDWQVCEYVISEYDQCIDVKEYSLVINPYISFNFDRSGKIIIYDKNIKLGVERDGSLDYDFNNYFVFSVYNFEENEISFKLIEYFLNTKKNANNEINCKDCIFHFDRFFSTNYTNQGYIAVKENTIEGGRFFYLDERVNGYNTLKYIYE